jgi:hypothetical protein
MNRQGVKSSNLKSVGYDAATSTLEVEFSNGTVWQYAAVPGDVYRDLMKAPSVGSYFAREVRGKFEASKAVQS